ncbi:MAG: dTDP-4-dehydrorhamnose 3,5-epimerase [Candidatus Heimdallarchaeum endolithica]|uniref:dTDP-4-dehydrorhamnose 3,5-epimerase n=1 Tax=Candidatus Heimdallarchaeum endolithica TaxID=2876572 RepID=A0A9Y1BSL9_9ARCH|nr:MAG: dTDP-4-dehydrorhamnose 3,5-epimerase [Candidatus Heimdallarchaeum endolithica]
MIKFNKIKTTLDGVFIIEPAIFSDERGFFMETYNKREFTKIGLDVDFVQDNHSKSSKGVLRGLHYQSKHPQGKLVRVIKGRVFDVAVDLRVGSPNFGQYYGVELSEKNKRMFYIPEGFAHGFLALEESEFVYKTTDYYYSAYDRGIRWNDPDINIKWPLDKIEDSRLILSEKDSNLPFLKDIESPFEYKKG